MWDVWRESALRRSLRRAMAGVVLLGLALLFRGTFGIWDAGANEPIRLPGSFGVEAARTGDGTSYAARAAPGQRLPLARPAGLPLQASVEASNVTRPMRKPTHAPAHEPIRSHPDCR